MTTSPDSEAIADFWRWTHWTAGRLTNPYHPLYDDVVQEGLIEAWRILQIKGGREKVSASYLVMGMRGRMSAVALGGKPMYGGDRRPGPRSEPTNTISIEHLMTAAMAAANKRPTGRTNEIERLTQRVTISPLEAIEIAYHHGEIAQALNELAPDDREYVVLRFWCGYTDTEIARQRRVDHRNVWQNWRRRIRPHLQARLNHLVDCG